MCVGGEGGRGGATAQSRNPNHKRHLQTWCRCGFAACGVRLRMNQPGSDRPAAMQLSRPGQPPRAVRLGRSVVGSRLQQRGATTSLACRLIRTGGPWPCPPMIMPSALQGWAAWQRAQAGRHSLAKPQAGSAGRGPGSAWGTPAQAQAVAACSAATWTGCSIHGEARFAHQFLANAQNSSRCGSTATAGSPRFRCGRPAGGTAMARPGGCARGSAAAG